MKDLKYTNKTIKMHDETWEKLKKQRKKSGLSWNLFLISLIEKK